MEKSSLELQRLLQRHLDAHQKSESNSTEKSQPSVPLEARVEKIGTDVEAWALQHSVAGLELNNNGDVDGKNSLQDCVSATLCRLMDCVMATESSSDSKDAVERCLELIAAVAVRCESRGIFQNKSSSSVDSCSIVATVLDRAQEFSGVVLERVRSSACKWIGFFARAWVDEYYQNNQRKSNKKSKNNRKQKHCISEDAFFDMLEQAAEGLLPRLTDKSVAVRQAALVATESFWRSVPPDTQLQFPDAVQNLQSALLWNLQHDSSVAVRSISVQYCPLEYSGMTDSLDYLLGRVRDVKPRVRVAALDVLREKVSVQTDLGAAEAAALVRAGLMNNRCKLTKEACAKMVCLGWMKSFKYDPIAMLDKMNAVLHEEECEAAVRCVLDAAEEENESNTLQGMSRPEMCAFRKGIDDALISLQGDNEQELDASAVFFSRVFLQRASESKKLTTAQKEALTTKVLPDIPALCQIFERNAAKLIKTIYEEPDGGCSGIVQSQTRQKDRLTAICLQILLLVETVELEEGSRRHLCGAMKGMLCSINTPDDLVEGCVNTLLSVYEREAELLMAIEEIVDHLSEDSNGCQGEKDDNNDDGDDLVISRRIRILSVLTIVLEKASARIASHPAIISGFAKHIVPAVTNENTNGLVREAAVTCLGRLGLFTDQETVLKEFQPILLRTATNEAEPMEVRAQAVLALADWSMLFPTALKPYPVSVVQREEPKMISLVDLVTELMDHPVSSVCAIGAEVATRLLFSGLVCDSKWLAQLMSLFFADIDSAEESSLAESEMGSPVRLQQILSLFFPAYAVKSWAGRAALIQSVEPLLEIVLLDTKKKKTKGKGSSKKKKNERKKVPPIVKMIEYLCSIVDLGTEKAAEIKAKVKQQADMLTGPQKEQDPAENKSADVDDDDKEIESTAALQAAVHVARFLSHHNQNLSDLVLRQLCKLLGDTVVEPNCGNVRTDHVRVLQKYLEEVGMEITNGACLKSLSKLNDCLASLELCSESDDKEDDGDDEEEASLVERFGTAVRISGAFEEADDKENTPRTNRNHRSVGSDGDIKTSAKSKEGVGATYTTGNIPVVPIGTRFFKTFPGHGRFEGRVMGFDGELYEILYPQDGDTENFDAEDFASSDVEIIIEKNSNNKLDDNDDEETETESESEGVTPAGKARKSRSSIEANSARTSQSSVPSRRTRSSLRRLH